MVSSLAGQTALVTGASRGIGAAVARLLAANGAHVILVARTVGGLEEVDDAIREKGGSATLVPLDLTDGEGIDRLGGAVAERWGRLDILVANAGVLGPMSPLSHVPPKEWDKVLAVNLTACWRLIRSFDPLLQAADHGQALFVSSAAAIKYRAYWGPYAVSKAALDMMVKTYALEIAKTPATANLIDPGATRTGMRAEAMPGEDPMTLPTPEAVAELFLALLSRAHGYNGEAFCFAEFSQSGTLQPRT